MDIEVKSNLKCWKSRFCRYVQYKYSACHETRKKAIQPHVFHRHIQNEFSVICWTKEKIQALYSPTKSDFTNAEMLHINRIQRRLQPSNHSLMMQLKKKIRSYIYIYIYIYTHTHTHTYIYTHWAGRNEQHDIWGKWRYALIQRVRATWHVFLNSAQMSAGVQHRFLCPVQKQSL